MGMSPREVGATSLWHFMAAVDGWSVANGREKETSGGASMSDQRLAELGIEGF